MKSLEGQRGVEDVRAHRGEIGNEAKPVNGNEVDATIELCTSVTELQPIVEGDDPRGAPYELRLLGRELEMPGQHQIDGQDMPTGEGGEEVRPNMPGLDPGVPSEDTDKLLHRGGAGPPPGCGHSRQ